MHGNLKRGESVLIHSGAGGVGQAAINIASFYNCNIFTTVGSEKKRQFIKQHFSQVGGYGRALYSPTANPKKVLKDVASGAKSRLMWGGGW